MQPSRTIEGTEYPMVVAPKEQLRRLVEAIPHTRPELADILIELGSRLIVASQDDELLYRRLLRELDEVQASSDGPDELRAKVRELRDRWAHPSYEADPLLQMLESAPIDDEPL